MKRSLSVVTLGAVVGVLIALLSGCSVIGREASGGSLSIPSASLTPSVQPSPSGAALSVVPSAGPTPTQTAPAPPTVPGYTLGAPKEAVHRKFQTVAGQFKGVFAGLTVRTVVTGKQQVGSLVLLGLDPGLVGNTQVEQRLVPGMVKGMSGQGAKVSTQNLNGQSVVVATTKSTNIVAWYRSGTVVLVLGNGTDPARSLSFTKACLAALPRTPSP